MSDRYFMVKSWSWKDSLCYLMLIVLSIIALKLVVLYITVMI